MTRSETATEQDPDQDIEAIDIAIAIDRQQERPQNRANTEERCSTYAAIVASARQRRGQTCRDQNRPTQNHQDELTQTDHGQNTCRGEATRTYSNHTNQPT